MCVCRLQPGGRLAQAITGHLEILSFTSLLPGNTHYISLLPGNTHTTHRCYLLLPDNTHYPSLLSDLYYLVTRTNHRCYLVTRTNDCHYLVTRTNDCHYLLPIVTTCGRSGRGSVLQSKGSEVTGSTYTMTRVLTYPRAGLARGKVLLVLDKNPHSCSELLRKRGNVLGDGFPNVALATPRAPGPRPIEDDTRRSRGPLPRVPGADAVLGPSR
ncbi:hypothetical protein J6590_027110 [Homalodisca vitripennis]|nr:hypothetical protein J6590_027110 [Homalodisca vitripennis]